MTAIDPDRARAAREHPDAEHIRQDHDGRPMYRFALSDQMDGKEWGAEVWAYDFADAEARVGAPVYLVFTMVELISIYRALAMRDHHGYGC
jgi:hypothetical protein